MNDPVYLPGGRDAHGTLDIAAAAADGATADADIDAAAADGCAVACPPHPQHGGHRGDRRLRAVSDDVVAAGSDCLRFDYGPWDGGRGERTDALHAVEWAGRRYDRVALFGYSFGAAVAVSAAAHGADVVAVAALAPPARVGSARPDDTPDGAGGIDTVADFESLPTSLPVGVFYGSRDDVAAVGPVVDCARERGATVREFTAGHSFVGQTNDVATAIVAFLQPALHGDVSR